MIRSWGLLALVGLLAGPIGVRAQEAYTIKVKKAAQGQSGLVDKAEQSNDQFKLVDNNGNALKDEDTKKSHHYAYRETILEKKAGAKRASRIKRQYEKATVTEGGETTKLPYEGKTVLIEKKGERYTFHVEGGDELTGADAKRLDKEFNKKGELDDDTLEKLLLPGKAVKVNETWKIDPAVLAKAFQDDASMELFPDKSSGTGQLTRAYKKGGQQFGVIRLRLNIALKALTQNGKSMVLQPNSKVTLDMTVDTCIDGSSTTVSGTFTADAHIEALLPSPDQAMFALNVTSKGKGSFKTVEQ